jgi:universal stress protein E
MKKFLVATDLSVRSDRALKRAAALAHERVAEFEVLHVVDASLPDVMLGRVEDASRSAMLDQISSLGLAREGACRTVIVRGQDYADIIKHAENSGTDLIVLGVPRDSAPTMFRGTTAERVIRSSHVPVLVVRNVVVKSYQRVLVAVDLSVHSRRALQVAARLVPKGEFYLIHATHEPFIGFLGRDSIEQLVRDEERELRLLVESDIRDLQDRMGTEAPTCVIIVQPGAAQAVIRDQIGNLKPDLVAVGTHGRTGISNMLLGSVAHDILADSSVDVLAVKA